MTQHVLLPALWGLVLLCSFIGYGTVLERLLFGRERFGWANKAAWGMSFYLVTGGIMIGFHAVSRLFLLAMVLVGCLFGLADAVAGRVHLHEGFVVVREKMRARPYIYALRVSAIGVIVLLVAIQYLASSDLTPLVAMKRYASLMDDLRGYFVFPKQILESTAESPSSSRSA
ncbi:MAG: hypothetical protein HY742_09155 [Deltaproteobacteria bacterium]|nr:hypothetical protein [Deltaproteobacteria bacterium]